ncbi:MAG: MATE family efflux transporter [Anaerolineales bacterium]|nr:MATE family efflux transporter [Anaerolineales bacterium]
MQKQALFKSKTGLTWQVALLAGPLVLQNLSQTLLGVVDTFFVSRIGTDALAAVGLASVMYFAVFMLFRSTANSTVVFVGRAFGEQDYEKIGMVVWRSLNMIAWLSLFVLVLPWLFAQLMAIAAPTDSPAVQDFGTQYLQIRAFEIPLIMFSGVVWGFLVGRGDSRTPMILAWLTVGINIVLDWLLVLGNLGFPALGVAGAAYATVMANGFNVLLSAIILWWPTNRARFFTGRAYLASWSDLKRVLQIGLPMGVGDFIEIASFSAFFALIGRLGTDILAANQIALQYMSVSFTFGMAVSMASSSLVSQYLGAKLPEQAEKAAYRACYLAMAGMGIIGLTYLIAPQALMSLFSQEATVIEAGVTILQLVALYQVFDAVGIVLTGSLNGAGDTTFTMITRSVLAWGGFIPLVWLLIFPLDLGIWGAWLGALIYLGGLAIIYFFRFRSGRWKTIELA